MDGGERIIVKKAVFLLWETPGQPNFESSNFVEKFSVQAPII